MKLPRRGNAVHSAPQATPPPEPDTLAFVLRDGTPVVIRPIVPEDKTPLQEGFTRLSDVSRYLRFMGPVRRLTEDQLRYLTEIDYEDHMAWVAFDVSGPEPQGVGVARYIRFTHESRKAEVAVTVVDSHQGRGMGTLLLAALTHSAAKRGIECFVSEVLIQNVAAIRIARDLRATFQPQGGGVLRVEIPLPCHPDEVTSDPVKEALTAVAQELLVASR
jgi:RimJ/RimL family protein N-acetyltransferase